MNSAVLTTILGSEGAFQVLGKLQRSSVTSYPTKELATLIESCGVADPVVTVDELLEANLLYRRRDGLAITRFGMRTALLLEAIHGGDLRDVWRRLSSLDPGLRTFELIRNQLTTAFLSGLSRRPGFPTPLYLFTVDQSRHAPAPALDARRDARGGSRDFRHHAPDQRRWSAAWREAPARPWCDPVPQQVSPHQALHSRA